MAANLFGIQKQIKEDQFITLAAPVKTDNCIMAVYPAIVQEAFALTMDNYRRYIASYNFKTNAENIENENYNQTVVDYFKHEIVTPVQLKLIDMFSHRNKNLNPRDWNDQVAEFSKEHGNLIQKKKIQTVKYGTEQVFQNFLHLYNSQLMKRNTEYMRFRVTAARPLQELELNSFLVTQLKRNEVQSLDLCKKSVRNHRQRLEEAGVLIDYHFQGAQRAVKVAVNAEILVVFDMKTSKMILPENQRVSPPKMKVLPDNNDNTRTIINEYQMNADASSQLDKEFAPLTPVNLLFYKNTTSKEQNSEFPPPPAGVKILNTMPQLSGMDENDCPAGKPEQTLSQKLAGLIVDPHDLAKQLAEKEFNNYTPIDIRILSKEAFTGTLTNNEFRELALQDFFKSASKIYRNTTPFTGSWKLAINHIYENYFVSFRGGALNKSTLIDDIQALRWRLDYANRWFIKNDFNPLFPREYFDITRTTKQEVGFEYTKKAWDKHKKHLKDSELRKKKREAAAALRKTKINHAKKCETEVKRFLKNKITLPQLLQYVEKNLPPEFMDQLPEIVEKHRNKI